MKNNQAKEKVRGRYAPFVAMAITSIALVSALIAALMCFEQKQNNTRARLDDVYRNAVYQTAEGLEQIQTEFSKLTVAREMNPYVGKTYENISTAAAVCETNLSYIPVSYQTTLSLSGFLNQVGDFARSRSGGENVNALYEASKAVNSAFKKFMRDYDESVFDGIYVPKDELLFDGIDYPELIYDGAFSDGIKHKCYKGLEKLDLVSESHAAQLASDVLSADNIKLLGVNEDPEAYIFSLTSEGREGTVTVSKRGGIILNFTLDCKEPDTLPKGVAIEKAKAYARKLGFDKLDCVWYNVADGYNYVNLAPVKDGIKYYTDLVKVKLSGECLSGFESLGYCTNHTERNYLPVITEQVALSKLPEGFDTEADSLAVIPNPKGEQLCYEFYGEMHGDIYYVYVSATDAQIVDVLQVISDSHRGELIV